MSEAAYRELCRECFESLDRVDPALDPAIEGAFELFGETCFELARDVLLNSDPSERPQRARERLVRANAYFQRACCVARTSS